MRATAGATRSYLIELTDGADRVVVVHNLGEAPGGLALAPRAGVEPLFTTDPTARWLDGRITLPGNGSGVWRTH